MDRANDLVRKDVKDARRLARDILREAQRDDLFTWADERDVIGVVVEAINELALSMHGTIELAGKSQASAQTAGQLNALIGKRYHINLKKTAWKALIASVPIALSIFRATTDHTAYVAMGGSFLSAIEMVRDNLQKLTPDQVVVYLAVKALNKQTKSAPNAAALASFINAEVREKDKWTIAGIEQLLEKMALKKILKEDGDGFRIVV